MLELYHTSTGFISLWWCPAFCWRHTTTENRQPVLSAFTARPKSSLANNKSSAFFSLHSAGFSSVVPNWGVVQQNECFPSQIATTQRTSILPNVSNIPPRKKVYSASWASNKELLVPNRLGLAAVNTLQDSTVIHICYINCGAN